MNCKECGFEHIGMTCQNFIDAMRAWDHEPCTNCGFGPLWPHKKCKECNSFFE